MNRATIEACTHTSLSLGTRPGGPVRVMYVFRFPTNIYDQGARLIDIIMALKAPLAADDALRELDSYLEHEEEDIDSSTDCEAVNSVCGRCKAGGAKVVQLLVSAVSNGHKTCLSEILQVQAHVDLLDARGEKNITLAHIAVRSGNLDILRMLVKTEQALVNGHDERGATPLHVCAYYGHINCLRCLLQAGAQIDGKDLDGATALHFAAASGHLDCLKDLVTIGNADPNERTNGGETAG